MTQMQLFICCKADDDYDDDDDIIIHLAAKQMRLERTLASAWLSRPIRPLLTRIFATFEQNTYFEFDFLSSDLEGLHADAILTEEYWGAIRAKGKLPALGKQVVIKVKLFEISHVLNT